MFSCTKMSRLRCQTYKGQLHGTTEACGRRFRFSGPAIIGDAGQWEIGFGFIDGGGGGHGSCDVVRLSRVMQYLDLLM